MDFVPAGRTARAFEEQQAALGARLHASSGSDTTSFLLSSLSRELPATIALWANYVRNPGFRAEDMERARTLSLSAISQSLAEPTAIAQRRSEEHTSELQSLMRNSYAVFCLKKK